MFEIDILAHNTAIYFRRQAESNGDQEMVSYWENVRLDIQKRITINGELSRFKSIASGKNWELCGD